MEVAPDVFKTETPLSATGKASFDAIAARLGMLNPPIAIAQHIAQNEPPRRVEYSSLLAGNSTLDGINFIAVNPSALASAFDAATDRWGQKALTSMKEDPGHWALKASFGATIGMGWREVWRPEPHLPPASVLDAPGKGSTVMTMRFGTAGSALRFTALHCAVDQRSGGCNIHIDETGFVLGMPTGGVALTPSTYDHLMNELLVKTKFRDWLAGKMPNKEAAYIVGEVIRRLSMVFPNASNGFAGLDKTVNGLRTPRSVLEGLGTAARILRPIGATFDVYDNDKFKVQVTGAIVDGDSSITVSIGGEW